MSIDLKHLRYAEVAERCGSFRKAADSLSLKQSNLSRRVSTAAPPTGAVSSLRKTTSARVKHTWNTMAA
jgi:Bacterial regulatory helix-turn-helix protein, lysR family